MPPPSLPIPPYDGYGGTQRGIYDFIEELNKKEECKKIYLFAPGDSLLEGFDKVKLITNLEKSLWHPQNNWPIEIKDKKEKHYINFIINHPINSVVDIINIRYDNAEIIKNLSKKYSNKIVYSLHNTSNPEKIKVIKENNITAIAHCNEHKGDYLNYDNILVVPYGINIDAYPFEERSLIEAKRPLLEVQWLIKNRKKEYLLILSAIGKHKGQKTAIKIAREVGLPVVIAGTPQVRKNKRNLEYFLKEVKPYIDGENVFYFGNASEEIKKELMRYAKAFIFPSGYEDSEWKEPFGRVVVEALACGTPVIAYNKGGPKDILQGFEEGRWLFNSLEDVIKLLKNESNFSKERRKKARMYVKQFFYKKRVAEDYLKIFMRLVRE